MKELLLNVMLDPTRKGLEMAVFHDANLLFLSRFL